MSSLITKKTKLCKICDKKFETFSNNAKFCNECKENKKKKTNLCECGCGILTKKRFIRGHNKPMLNQHHSNETKKKISKKSKENFTNPKFKEYFKYRNKYAHNTLQARKNNSAAQNRPEVKAKLIENRINQFKDPIKRERHRIACQKAQSRIEVKEKRKKTKNIPEVREKFKRIMKEAANRPEVKKKRAEGVKRAYENPERRKNLSIAMRRPETQIKRANTIAKHIAEGTLKSQKVFNTKPELLVEQELLKNNYILGKTLIKQYHCKNVGMIDFYLPIKNIIIEVYGDYWHCNPKFYHANYYHKNLNMIAEQIWIKDQKKNEKCLNLGYKVVLLWENDIVKNTEVCLSKLVNILKG